MRKSYLYEVSTTVADPGFSPGGAPTSKNALIFQFFAENCMKMKEFGPPGGARVPGAPLGSANALEAPEGICKVSDPKCHLQPIQEFSASCWKNIS